jgi:hypothetical protein
MTAYDKIIRYLMSHPSGVSGAQLRAWLDSCRKNGGFTIAEQESALLQGRTEGRIACTNGTWWLKDIPTAQKGLDDERRRLAKTRREDRAKLKAS